MAKTTSLQLSAAELRAYGFKEPFIEEFLSIERALRKLQLQAVDFADLLGALQVEVDTKVTNISGQATVPASATSLVVAQASVTGASKIWVQVASNDATMTSAQVVAGTGDFEIFPDAAPTVDCLVNWLVIND